MRKDTFAALLVLGLALSACTGSRPPTVSLSQPRETESEPEAEWKALEQALEISYQREQEMAERLRQTEEICARLQQEIEASREENAALRAQLESRQSPSPQTETGPVAVASPGELGVLDIYSEALAQYHQRQYQRALEQFDRLLRTAPYSEWTDNAQYWKGECSYGLGKYQQALTEFTKVFVYPKTEKAADAQVMIARCYLALGEKEKALAAFQKLLNEYPESKYAPMARKEIKYLQGH